jgi:hypothetical protein
MAGLWMARRFKDDRGEPLSWKERGRGEVFGLETLA